MTAPDSSPHTGSGQRRNRLRSFFESADVLLLLALFAGLAALSTTYADSARQFPQVFMYAGIVVLGIQLLINLLPERYSVPLQRYTSGLADDMKFDDEEEEASGNSPPPTERASSGELRQRYARLVLIFGLVTGYFLASYLIGFLLSTPLFVFATVYTLGSRDYRYAVVLSVSFMLMIYLLFGELMNVPIMEGILVT